MFDFGDSFFRDRPVVDLILDKMPVSISLGLWTTLIIYLISIPLGVAKAVRDGSDFDVWTSGVVVVGNAVPGFLFAVFLLVAVRRRQLPRLVPAARPGLGQLARALAGRHGSLDYFWHMALPITALSIGGFATLTMLTKNSFLDQIHQQYVMTARAKGLTERRVLYGHVFRNAMLIVIAGFPGAVHRHAVHRLGADRGDLLARRPRPARLRGGVQPRLPGDVRHALHLHPAGPGDEPGRRHDLHARRSAHRLRERAS